VFSLAHLSDPHLAPLPSPHPGDLASKRLLGYLNWLRKRRAIHRRDVLAAIVADLHAAHADHIAVTGDLVNIALPAEIENAARWLAELGPPAQLSLVPGNHDAYVPGAAARCTEAWGAHMAGDPPRMGREGRGEGASPLAGASEAETREADEEHDAFPFLRIRGPVALIGVSTAVPTAPFLATGKLGARQMGEMTALLAAAAGQFRVVLIHHPPHVVPTSRFKRLVDAAAFRDAIATAGAELVIHGHDHVRSLAYIDGPRARVPVIGAPSASAAFGKDHDPAGYNLYRIDGRPGAWTCGVERRGLDAHGAVSVCERFVV
jgi:3',5'-cyclic AMP phosphodiesterase CpdA